MEENQVQNGNPNPIMQTPSSQIPPPPPAPKKGGVNVLTILLLLLVIVLAFLLGLAVNKIPGGIQGLFATNTVTEEIHQNEAENVVDEEEVNYDIEENVVEDNSVEENVVDEETTNMTEFSSTDWKSGEFSIEGVMYKLNTDYTNLTKNGWYVDWEYYGYADGYILNKEQKISSTIDLLNKDYEDCEVSIGFVNLGTSAKDAKECQFWAIDVDNSYADTEIKFELPGGIKNGSTYEDIKAVYGEVEEDNMYRSEELKYTEYTYENDYTETLRLTVYDDKGLVAFDYKIY